MGYAALSCLGDALDATEDLLLPFDRRLWLRLAVVVFFLSGGSGVGSLPNVSWQVPLKTYTRYYELFVLGDIEPDLDLVGDRREDVRAGPL